MTARVVPVGIVGSYVRALLDGDPLLGDVWVEGEVSNLFRAQSGHVYFTLKDNGRQLKCVLFRAQAARHRRIPQLGDHVAAHGHVTVYERDSGLQLYADVVQPAGIGLLALQLERLRQRLEAEGLFEQTRKRPLPAAPRVIGVVTSPDGAVWHDIQNVLQRRYPLTEVVLSPTLVQGDRAPTAIVTAIEALQADGRAEVVIVARGGGSAEDLLAFNDEAVVRAVFACPVPVVSGVGHETDWTLVDAVADLRAPTPSAAAELCVPAVSDLADRLTELRARLVRSARETVDRERNQHQAARKRLRRLDMAGKVKEERRRAALVTDRAASRQRASLSEIRGRYTLQAGLLHALAPVAVLRRGYAALADAKTGVPVYAMGDAEVGRLMRTDLADGALLVRIEDGSPLSGLATDTSL